MTITNRRNSIISLIRFALGLCSPWFVSLSCSPKVLWLLDFLVNLLEHSLGKVLSTEVARCYASLFRPY
ncbi:hypothetical protein QL285_032787 [Trifolium repens]|nr:hypothetical protein QL285_032787 [Trifolium repens]